MVGDGERVLVSMTCRGEEGMILIDSQWEIMRRGRRSPEESQRVGLPNSFISKYSACQNATSWVSFSDPQHYCGIFPFSLFKSYI